MVLAKWLLTIVIMAFDVSLQTFCDVIPNNFSTLDFLKKDDAKYAFPFVSLFPNMKY